MLFLRKNIMAFTGLFLCLFLVIHLAGNLILLLPKDHAKDIYNLYSHTLGENLLIKVVSIALYLSIILHSIYALLITLKNNKAQGVEYAVKSNTGISTWTSQNMGSLGFIILIFIVIHMANFWMRIKLGIGEAVPTTQQGYKDVYSVTTALFRNPFYVIFYSALMIPLCLHLSHGVSSAFKTIGVYKKSYIKWIDKVGKYYAYAISFGFFVIPIVVYLRGMK